MTHPWCHAAKSIVSCFVQYERLCLICQGWLCFPQIGGALLVVAGVVTAAWPTQGASVFTEASMALISGVPLIQHSHSA